MKRRQLLKAAGATTAAVAIAGCTGDNAAGEANQTDTGDEPISPNEAGLFDTQVTFLDEQTPQDVKLKNINIYQTETTVGVQGKACNKRGQAITKLVIHARLLKENGDEFDVFENSLEQAALDDLGANECWTFTIPFEGSDPEEVAKKVANVKVWATIQTTGDEA